MASTYVNDLRLNEMATGDGSGTWGTTTNTNLELIAEAFSYGTEVITTNADTHTTTIADGATDPGQSLYLKYTGTLDSACTITIGPNTVSKVWIVENGTSGSQDIILSQGSGADITIPAGDTKVVYSDGAGAGAAFFDAFASINVGALTGTSLDISGDIDVDGTTNLDVVDIDGAVDMATTLAVAGNVDFNGDLDVDGTTETDVLTINGSQFNYKAFGTSSIMIGDTTTGTISAADYNTGVGVNVFEDLTSGDNNSAFGFNALTNITTGGNNTAIGRTAMVSTTTQSDNTAVGYAALNVNAAANNTAVGSSALAANTTGSENTAVGTLALDANTEGPYNTAVGYGSLSANVTGNQNTAVGYLSLAANTTTKNTAVGAFAQYQSTSATECTAVGYGALSALTTGSYNTAIGSGALASLTTPTHNTALGFNAGTTNETGGDNVYIGNYAGNSSTGVRNTYVGYTAGYENSTADDNTCLGYAAGTNQTTGGQNVFIGRSARGSSGGTSVSIAIGFDIVGAGDYFTTLGTGAGASRVYNQFSANASWTRASDIRYKDEIANNTDCGLAFINDLRPVTFKFKAQADIDSSLPDYDSNKTSRVYDKKMYGLIAQEVKQAMDDNNITDFAGWDETDNGIQGISQEMFVHPLIKAVQELSAKNDALEARIAALES
jgi:trimeric autotransporter adhesin